MKPPIEFRPPPPTEHQKRISKAMVAHHKRRKAAQKPPKPRAGGRWVWVPDGWDAKLERSDARRERMREYMRKRRAKEPK
jgi:hypothetical protein